MSIGGQLEELLGAAGQPFSREMERRGLTLAKVTNITDDQKLNRVKCLPIGQADKEETDWCYVMASLGGKECGQFFFPNVDDLVVLAYLDGDPHRPFVLGAFWNSEVKPPYTIEGGKVHNFSIKTPNKTELLFYDEPKKERVTLTMPSKTVLTIDDEKQLISLSDKEEKNFLKLDLKGGEVVLQAKTKLTLTCGKSSVELDSGGNITIKGGGTVSLEGTTLQGKGTSKLALQGASVEVKADATMDLNASGPLSAKGAIVKIN